MTAYYCPDSLPNIMASFFPTENQDELPRFTITALVLVRELAESGNYASPLLDMARQLTEIENVASLLPEPGVYPNEYLDDVDIYLDVKLIDEETARQAIANHLGVPAEQISFVYRAGCQAA